MVIKKNKKKRIFIKSKKKTKHDNYIFGYRLCKLNFTKLLNNEFIIISLKFCLAKCTCENWGKWGLKEEEEQCIVVQCVYSLAAEPCLCLAMWQWCPSSRTPVS